MVLTGIPQLNAWRDTLTSAGKNVHYYQPIRNGIQKYAFPVHDQFDQVGFALENIVFLHQHNKGTMYSQAVQGGERLKRMIQHAYFMETVADKARHFQISTTVVKQAFWVDITYNELINPVNQVTDYILKELR